jgi:hypothetical protein
MREHINHVGKVYPFAADVDILDAINFILPVVRTPQHMMYSSVTNSHIIVTRYSRASSLINARFCSLLC